MSTTTPSMSLLIPDVGDSDYSDSIESSLTILDTHTHASGSGTQIPTGGIADSAVTAAKIGSNAVTTAKILAANVTRAKLEAVGQQSAALGSPVAVSVTIPADVAGLSVSITTTGRPVMVGLANAYLQVDGGATVLGATIAILRDATTVASYNIPITSAYSTVYPLALWILDAPAAGTYTYKIQSGRSVGASGDLTFVTGIKLTAYEL